MILHSPLAMVPSLLRREFYCCPPAAKRPRRLTGVSQFSSVLQDFLEWRDPDSNRGHHAFQSYKTRFT